MKNLIIALALLVAGARTADAKVHVVTTVQTFKYIAQEIGGSKVHVDALVGENVDPHFVQAKPSYAKVVNSADLLVYVGLDLEVGWLPPIIDNARNAKVATSAQGNLDASAGIKVKDAGAKSRAEGDIHPIGNPHYWLTPDNAQVVAREIADRLKAIDSANAETYEANYVEFEKKLAAHRKQWEKDAAVLKGVKVVTYHKSWSYTTDWLGMQEIGYIEPKPGVPPDPKHLAQLTQDAKKQGAKMVIMESFYPENTAKRVAELGGMKLVVLPSDAGGQLKSYWDLVDYDVAQLVAAAK